MVSKDHLDKEISVSAELTETGIKAAAKSRLLSGFDRFGGNIAELLNVRIESDISSRRSRIEAERRIVDAATKSIVRRLASDDQLAERMLTDQLRGAFQKQENKEGVLQAALEDLRRQPPTNEEANEGPEHLDQSFTARLEHYAEFATTDELRERWGRVLAAEIRKPGNFSLKVLRIIDELEPHVAALFEQVCLNRIGVFIPRCLSPLSEDELRLLDEAGLVIKVPLGHSIDGRRVKSPDGADILLFALGRSNFVGMDATANVPKSDDLETDDPIRRFMGSEDVSIPVHVLTGVGRAISSLLPDHESLALAGLAKALAHAVAPSAIRTYDVKDGSLRMTNLITEPAPMSAGLDNAQ